jgi:CBS domain containing-hemolysin-like protein
VIDAVTALSMGASLLVVAFANASEAALFSLRSSDRAALARDPSRAARIALELLETPRTNLVLIILLAVSADAVFFAMTADLAHALAAIHGWIAVPLTGAASVLVRLVVGEITPKAIASVAPRRTAALAAYPVRLLERLLSRLTTPIEEWLTSITGAVERLVPDPPSLVTDQDIVGHVEAELACGRLARGPSFRLIDALETRSRLVREVMTPRHEIVAFDLREGRAAFLRLLRARGHRAIPVHDGAGLDAITGFLRGRTVLSNPASELAPLVEPASYVPETLPLIELDRRVAVVLDEHGDTAGIVTPGDVTRDLLGLWPPSEKIRARGAGAFTIEGSARVREAAEALAVRFPTRGQATLAGLLAVELGRIPRSGDEVVLAGVHFRVERATERGALEVAALVAGPGESAP